MKPSPHFRKPEHLDLIISNGSHAATGQFDVVLNCEGTMKCYPLLFLDEDDFSFEILRKRISGTTAPEGVMPVGKLKQVWKKDI